MRRRRRVEEDVLELLRGIALKLMRMDDKLDRLLEATGGDGGEEEMDA